jgi:hypothetical protein
MRLSLAPLPVSRRGDSLAVRRYNEPIGSRCFRMPRQPPGKSNAHETTGCCRSFQKHSSLLQARAYAKK